MIRCAIYTRKSSEEGLEQSFNSLDAQREACEAYIRSQRHEGWQAIHSHYDDGGFSGGNMERPALQRLMTDIESGKINTVVVYKVDRLTRSLADFAKIIEKLDARQVSFVSVTQQFNTTTSMGRLTLNVLLSFAQFEREVTGERIRDKIAASKKKGMWMGGFVPLGYYVRDRKLHIDEAEAQTVRTIFNEFLRLGNVTLLREWLRENNVRSKDGNHFLRGPLYLILHNPIYIGLIRHKADTYPGQHPAILERDTWDKVQALLTENIQGKRRKLRATKESLFTGKIFDQLGNLYTPTHATKNGRRYRYYTSQAVIRKREDMDVPARIPAHDLEAAVMDRIVMLLNAPQELLTILIQNGEIRPGVRSQILARASAKAAAWSTLTIGEREHFTKSIINRIIIHAQHIENRLDVGRLLQQFSSSKRSRQPDYESNAQTPRIASLQCAFRHVPKGESVRLVVCENQPAPDASRMAMLKAIARARQWYDQIVLGEAGSLQDIARLHNISIQYVKHIFRLAFLSPASIELVVSGRNSSELSLNGLFSCACQVWNRQYPQPVK